MVGKALQLGFYWSTTTSDMAQIMRSCKGCQCFMRQIHALAQELQTILVIWPFAVWGLDLLGSFKKVPEGLTHLLVTIDKFTKWIKARPLAKISSMQALSSV
jgi:hypothetical protein